MRAVSKGLLILALLAGPALAQEPTDDILGGMGVEEEGGPKSDDPGLDFDQISLEQLLQEEVVTTGAKREVGAGASLSTMSVLTEDQINALPYFYLGDLLGVLPGLDVRWGKMQRYYVGGRGLGGGSLNARMLLLWDGVPMNDPFTGELTAGHFLPLVDVERVEVIRGAGSTIYGANAFSGVVNVLTRNSGRGLKGVRASALYGSDLTTRVQIAGGAAPAGVRLYGSAEIFRTNGPLPVAERIMKEAVFQFKNDDVLSASVNGSVGYKGLRLSGRYTYGERGRPGTFPTDEAGNIRACDQCHNQTSQRGQGVKYPATEASCGTCHPAPFDREVQHRGSIALSFQRALGKGFHLSASGWHNEYRTSYSISAERPFLTTALYEPEIKQRGSGGEAYVSHSYKTYNTVLLGAEGRRYEAASDVIISPTGNRVTQSYGAVYLEDEFRPLKWLSITGGARLDYNADFGAVLSPRGGLVFTPVKRLAIKAGIARAFRNPALSELFVYDTRGRYTVIGKESLLRGALKPEYITSIEGGASYSVLFGRAFVLRGSAVGFYNESTNMISFRAEGVDTASFFNLGDAHVVGAEFEVEAEYKQRPEFKLFANYSWQRARDHAGVPLPYAPDNKANFGLLAKHGNISTLLRVRLIGERSIDEKVGVVLPRYATLDLAAQFGIWGGLNTSIWATNLTGSSHQESLGIPGAARSFFVSVSYAR